jgi:SNF2 family DNA or RNA helicase
MRAEIVVLDEAQRIKNYATKSAIYVKALTPEYRLVLTGTPMENRLEELASILDWVDDVALSPKWRLVPWYTRFDGDVGEGKSGARNLDTLRLRLQPCAVRRVRKEVLAQLPPRTDTRVPVEMTPQQSVAHEELAPAIASLMQRSKKRPLSQPEFLKLMQLLTQQRIIANGLGQLRFEDLWPTYNTARPDASLLEGLFAPKLLELRRLLADLVIAQGRKVVIFSQWRRMLRLAEWSVRDVLGDHGVGAVFFTGAEKQSQRTKSIVDFHDDPRVRVMFLSDAGGVGLNLQKAASACINLELPWNPAVIEQRIGRIYRLGQKHPIDVYNLVSEGSIEGRIAGLLGAKQALFSGLFDGTSDEIRFDSAPSFMSRVERLTEPAPTLEVPPAAGAEPDADAPGVEMDEAATEIATPADEVAVADASMSDELPSAASVSSSPSREPAAVGALFDVLKVERTVAGGVRIEAPPGAANELMALFEGMAKLLRGAASADPAPR